MNSYQPCNKDYKPEMGKRLRKCRLNSGLTQENMAEFLDISIKHYSEVERGITGLSVSKLIQLSDFFHVSLDYLIKGEESNKNFLPPLFTELYDSCPEEKKFYLMELLQNLSQLL